MYIRKGGGGGRGSCRRWITTCSSNLKISGGLIGSGGGGIITVHIKLIGGGGYIVHGYHTYLAEEVVVEVFVGITNPCYNKQ